MKIKTDQVPRRCSRCGNFFVGVLSVALCNGCLQFIKSAAAR